MYTEHDNQWCGPPFLLSSDFLCWLRRRSALLVSDFGWFWALFRKMTCGHECFGLWGLSRNLLAGRQSAVLFSLFDCLTFCLIIWVATCRVETVFRNELVQRNGWRFCCKVGVLLSMPPAAKQLWDDNQCRFFSFVLDDGANNSRLVTAFCVWICFKEEIGATVADFASKLGIF